MGMKQNRIKGVECNCLTLLVSVLLKPLQLSFLAFSLSEPLMVACGTTPMGRKAFPFSGDEPTLTNISPMASRSKFPIFFGVDQIGGGLVRGLVHRSSSLFCLSRTFAMCLPVIFAYIHWKGGRAAKDEYKAAIPPPSRIISTFLPPNRCTLAGHDYQDKRRRVVWYKAPLCFRIRLHSHCSI